MQSEAEKMITDVLHNLEQYRGLHKNLDTAIDFLKSCDLTALPDGKTVIDGEQVFVNVMEADLREAEGAAFEYHKKYADLQIDITGSECWEYTLTGDTTEEFNAESDVGFKSGTAACSGILGDGKFVIFLPDELHKPSCINHTCTHVRKAVVKIEM